MRRLQERARGEMASAVQVGVTVFRDDGSAALVTLVDLTFDGCEALSRETLVTGERLRIYQSGQGCIEAEVVWASEGRAEIRFLTDCKV